VFLATFLVTWDGAVLRQVSDDSVHMRLLHSPVCKSSRQPQSL